MNTMIIEGEEYPTDQPLWHTGDRITPRSVTPPPQSPDEGGIITK